jgi:hypothetical protein
MSLFAITRDEYEQRRDAFELCRWVNAQFRAMEGTGHFDEIYFERKGLNVPRFVAEAVPVSRLALLLATPGIEVHVTCFADSRNYDAEIEISGWRSRSFRVEVTTTEPDDVVLRRKALSRVGHVMLAGPIRAEGRNVIAEPEMVNVHEEEQRRTALMLKRLRNKVESGRYGANTAFLVTPPSSSTRQTCFGLGWTLVPTSSAMPNGTWPRSGYPRPACISRFRLTIRSCTCRALAKASDVAHSTR